MKMKKPAPQERCATCGGRRWGTADGMNEPGPCADCNPDGKFDAPRRAAIARAEAAEARVARWKARTERLEKAIKDAPHDEPCKARFDYGLYSFAHPSCDCWKSKALEGKP